MSQANEMNEIDIPHSSVQIELVVWAK